MQHGDRIIGVNNRHTVPVNDTDPWLTLIVVELKLVLPSADVLKSTGSSEIPPVHMIT